MAGTATALAAWLASPLGVAAVSGNIGARPSWSAGRSVTSLQEGAQPVSFAVTKIREFPHMGQPWTQGLEFRGDGMLLETSGNYPPGSGSFVRVVNPADGTIVQKISEGLELPRFIEGITQLGDRWFASTYEDQVALEYDADMHLTATHPFPWNGWGLTHDAAGRLLLATNGSEYITVVDPSTFKAVDTKVATCMGKRVFGLNELEMVPDLLGHGPTLLGNVINTRLVLGLDPSTAKCTSVFHLAGLEQLQSSEEYGFHVANGIAFNRESGHLIVTGKNWDSMFEVSLAPEGAGSGTALDMLAGHLDVARSVALSKISARLGP